MLFGIDFTIPGYLVLAALIYAIFGTALTQWIGSPLVNLDFNQQRLEADFRFNLVRVRENSEQIALLKGEPAERERLSERFSRVIANWYGIMSRTKRLTAFTQSYAQAAVVIPFALVSPAYFANKIQLGALTQTAEAFGRCRTRCPSSSRSTAPWRNGARWSPVSTDLRARSHSADDARDRARFDPQCGRRAASEINLQQLLVQAAERHSRWSRPTTSACAPANARCVTGPSGVRQVDPVPRHRRHLAVRRGRDRRFPPMHP